MSTIWMYGITTVPSRIYTTLPKTLESLALAGFVEPQLFVDGCKDHIAYRLLGENRSITYRYPALRIHGNWILSLYELYIRSPNADRFAIFQDDVIAYRNLKDYLDICSYPDKGYWNLYTFPPPHQSPPPDITADIRLQQRWCLPEHRGWYRSNQLGRGAIALVFNNEATQLLLSNSHIITRVKNTKIGHESIDGGIITAMSNVGWTEYVHDPSLTMHIGHDSTVGHPRYPISSTFRGEQYDARELI
jgi:hypothetical protein